MMTLARTTASYDHRRDAWRVLTEFRDGDRTIWVDGEWKADTTPEERCNDALRIALKERNLDKMTGMISYHRGERRSA